MVTIRFKDGRGLVFSLNDADRERRFIDTLDKIKRSGEQKSIKVKFIPGDYRIPVADVAEVKLIGFQTPGPLAGWIIASGAYMDMVEEAFGGDISSSSSANEPKAVEERLSSIDAIIDLMSRINWGK